MKMGLAIDWVEFEFRPPETGVRVVQDLGGRYLIMEEDGIETVVVPQYRQNPDGTVRVKVDTDTRNLGQDPGDVLARLNGLGYQPAQDGYFGPFRMKGVVGFKVGPEWGTPESIWQKPAYAR